MAFFLSLFILREREREHRNWGGTERVEERENRKQALTVNAEPDAKTQTQEFDLSPDQKSDA